MKQTDRLIAHLEQNYTITPFVAWAELGIYRLSDTVYKLRKQGYDIVTNSLTVHNKFGEKCVVAEYELRGNHE